MKQNNDAHTCKCNRENFHIYSSSIINKENLIVYKNDSIQHLANKIRAQNNKPKPHKLMYTKMDNQDTVTTQAQVHRTFPRKEPFLQASR